jgi:hypothetical protein
MHPDAIIAGLRQELQQNPEREQAIREEIQRVDSQERPTIVTTEPAVLSPADFDRSYLAGLRQELATAAKDREEEIKAEIARVIHVIRSEPEAPAAPAEQPKPAVEIPEGVVPGETPGWPVDAVTGEPLDLTPAQREELAKAELEPAGNGNDLEAKSRRDLNEIASGLGIESPEKLPNKDAVIHVIRSHSEASQDD